MPPCPAWVLQSRHPTEHILYCMGLKRSFDLVGAVQYLVFELLFEWAFARRDLKCVEFLARLNRDGRNMAFKRLLQVRRPTFLDTTSQPALWNTTTERMCWAFDRCHVCGKRAHLHNKNTGNPQTGELYTINVCFSCMANRLEMAAFQTIRAFRTDAPVRVNGEYRIAYKTFMKTIVASPTTKNRLLQLGGGELDCVFETWRPEGIKNRQRIFHYEDGSECKLSKTLRDDSATTLYRHELDRRDAREKRALQHLADLSNAVDDVGFPTSINEFNSSSGVWGLISRGVVPWLSYTRMLRPSFGQHVSDIDDDDSSMLEQAVVSCKCIVSLVQGFRSKAAAYEIAYNCDNLNMDLLLRMATTCALSLQVVSVQVWVHSKQPATQRSIHVVQCVLIAPYGDGLAWPRKTVHIPIVLKKQDFAVAFPGIAPVPGKACLAPERIQWEPIVCRPLGKNFLGRLGAAFNGKKRRVKLECSHNYKSPRRFYMLHSCSNSCCCSLPFDG